MATRKEKSTGMIAYSAETTSIAPAKRRVFDCCLFHGEMDVLVTRFHELDVVVDYFIIVESTSELDGAPREISFNACHQPIAPFAAKVRHVIVVDTPSNTDPWVRETWQRNAVLRGVPDASAEDLLVLSDADEIPRAAAIAEMTLDCSTERFGLRLAPCNFYASDQSIAGAEERSTWIIAATRRQLDNTTPDALRHGIRDGRIPARVFDQGGWHFVHLPDESVMQREIGASSSLECVVGEKHDLCARPDSLGQVRADDDLPLWLRRNREQSPEALQPTTVIDSTGGPAISTTRHRQKLPPIIICPYLYDHEAAEVRAKFKLDTPEGARMEFFLWQDSDRVGPEFAFEHCWNQFPDRDVIIIHSDMAPMPGDPAGQWYDALCYYRDDLLPNAGMIACNLFYPSLPNQALCVQSGGGTFANGRTGYLRGPLVRGLSNGAGIPVELLARVRLVDWVTFGGVLIRREVINACGPFDRSYRWAYMMDVDYSFEARLRGFRLMHVPVSLQHEENRTTRSLWELAPELRDHITYNIDRFYLKWDSFFRALPSEAIIGSNLVPTAKSKASLSGGKSRFLQPM